MSTYFIKPPWWLKKLYSPCIWEIPTGEKVLYLTFDDGPHPEATPFVLDALKKHDAKATFFCIGKNVAAHTDIYRQVINEGHQTGNHSFNHLNGWKTNTLAYLKDVVKAKDYIDSSLFRPPYGKISHWQISQLKKSLGLKIILWSVLSADFDEKVSEKKCLENVILNTAPGSIIVFHDSAKAYRNLTYTLPKVLSHYSSQGYRFDKINL